MAALVFLIAEYIEQPSPVFYDRVDDSRKIGYNNRVVGMRKMIFND